MADIERELALFKNAIYGEEVRDALISSIRAINNDKTGIVYKGTLGVGGTITALPAASASNSGYTYTVITAETYAGQSANIGDFFTSNGTSWKLTPFSNVTDPLKSDINDLKDNLSFFNANATSHSLDTAEGGIRLNKVEGKTHKSPNICPAVNTIIPIDKSKTICITKAGEGTYSVLGYKNGSHTMNINLNVADEYKIIDNLSSRDIDAIYIQSSTVQKIAVYYSNVAIPYEPYGMWSAGEMGLVDMGSLEYTRFNQGGNLYLFDCTSSLFIATENAYCNEYSIISQSVGWNDMSDKSIRFGAGRLRIRDDSCITVEELKAKLSGVPLAYEVADGATPSQRCLVVEENGKNLWDYSKTNHNFYNYTTGEKKTNVRYLSMGYDTFPIKKGQSVTLSYGTTDSSPWCAFIIFDRNGNFKKNVNISGTTITYTASEDELYSVQVYTTNSEAILGGNVSYIQLELSQTATSYTEHQGKTVFIPMTAPLCSVNSVKDELIKLWGSWKEHRKLGYEADLSLKNWTRYTPVTDKYVYYVEIPNMKAGNAQVILDKYTVRSSWVALPGLEDMMLEVHPSLSYIYIRDDRYTTVEDFKANLSDVPLIYELATDTYADVIDETPFYSLESYKDKTYIDTTDGLASLDVSYSKVDVGATAIANENKLGILSRLLDVFKLTKNTNTLSEYNPYNVSLKAHKLEMEATNSATISSKRRIVAQSFEGVELTGRNITANGQEIATE